MSLRLADREQLGYSKFHSAALQFGSQITCHHSAMTVEFDPFFFLQLDVVASVGIVAAQSS